MASRSFRIKQLWALSQQRRRRKPSPTPPPPDPDAQELTFTAEVSESGTIGYVFHDLSTLISNFEDTPALICINNVTAPHTQKIGFNGIGNLPHLVDAEFEIPGLGTLRAQDANLYTESNYFEFQWGVDSNPFVDGETFTILMRTDEPFMAHAVNLSGDGFPDVEGLSGEVGYIALSGNART